MTSGVFSASLDLWTNDGVQEDRGGECARRKAIERGGNTAKGQAILEFTKTANVHFVDGVVLEQLKIGVTATFFRLDAI